MFAFSFFLSFGVDTLLKTLSLFSCFAFSRLVSKGAVDVVDVFNVD